MSDLLKKYLAAKEAKAKKIIANIEETEEELTFLLSQCESQLNRLKQEKDVRWDCYDARNWKELVKSIKQIKKNIETIKKVKL